ncbi:MAG: bifunctional riboflavin kinase/FAD synthetase [Actinomycetota bacterium]|nr:bifunctional riboflavin kinase/FAD synthetase [Actinomycetota bacterium]
METIIGLESLGDLKGDTVVALGFFDGVHRGHKKTIMTCVTDAKTLGAKSVVLTFLPHPEAVLSPNEHPPILTDFDSKERLISELGVDLLLFIQFTLKFSKLTPEEFVDEVLLKRLSAVEVIVGDGFRFGHKARGDALLLKRLGEEKGFKVKALPLENFEGKPISSTRIRKLLMDGEIERAGKILGRYPSLSGTVVSGFGRGRSMGYSTANVELAEEIQLPQDGVYAGTAHFDGRSMKCVINIGSSPTFGLQDRRIEAYILDFDSDLYDKKIYLDLFAKLRSQEKFSSKEELARQIERDVRKAASLLA